MATPTNLIGLGMAHNLARRVGMHVQEVTIAGTSAGTATQIPGYSGIFYVIASNSGSGVKLPALGGINGSLVGDEVTVSNQFGASIQIYAANNGKGSAVTLVGIGSAVAGTTGIILLDKNNVTFKALNISTWIFIKTSA